jgi:hypothetical protein
VGASALMFGFDPRLTSTVLEVSFTLICFWAEELVEKASSIHVAAKMLRSVFFMLFDLIYLVVVIYKLYFLSAS